MLFRSPPHFSLICRHLEANPHLSHSHVEQHLLGITREQIGAWLRDLMGMALPGAAGLWVAAGLLALCMVWLELVRRVGRSLGVVAPPPKKLSF